MALLRNSVFVALAICALTSTQAQVSTINSAVLQPRVFNDVPGATMTAVNDYPSFITLSEIGVSAPTGFADRDVWRVSNNGTAPYALANNDYFHISVDLTLTGTPISPRKEAGLLLSGAASGDIQFIVNTDGHEVVQFGGISFYSFNVNNGITYNSGDKITLGMFYFDHNGKNALMFSANGINSPIFDFGPTVGSGSDGIGNGSTLGGYLQVVNDPANPSNGGSASFANITVVPEPSVMGLLALGLGTLLLRRRS